MALRKGGADLFELNLANVSQCVVPGVNKRDEIELQFHESDTVRECTRPPPPTTVPTAAHHGSPPPPANANHGPHHQAQKDDHGLVGMRLWVPGATAAEVQQKVMNKTAISSVTGEVLVTFDMDTGSFLMPRSHYEGKLSSREGPIPTPVFCHPIACARPLQSSCHLPMRAPHHHRRHRHPPVEMYDTFLRMHGNMYDYKIKYDDISRYYMLERPNGRCVTRAVHVGARPRTLAVFSASCFSPSTAFSTQEL